MPGICFLVFPNVRHVRQNFDTCVITYGDFMVIVEPWTCFRSLNSPLRIHLEDRRHTQRLFIGQKKAEKYSAV